MLKWLRVIYFLLPILGFSQEVAILKYEGGGDWYANPTAVPNLIEFCNSNINTKIDRKPKTVEPESADLFNYPIIFMTGHGHVNFSNFAAQQLKQYLISGGFLHISDNYGMDQYIRKEMKKVFPDLEFQLIPSNHPIYHQAFDFKSVPKIHEHDNQTAQGLGLFYQGKLVCFYDYESDLSDGWEDENIHNDPLEVRIKALQMGANIVSYAFKN